MADSPAFRNNGFPDIDIEELTALDEPDFGQMRDDRSQRTLQVMRVVNPGLTSQLLPQSCAARLSPEERAAIVIQKHFRGHQGRKAYTERLFLKFEEEERQRMEKMMQQVEEGELLVDNHKLEVLLDDGQTVRRNRNRQNICKVITIQRAWRVYRDRHSAAPHTQPPTVSCSADSANRRHHNTTASEDDDIDVVGHVINLDDIHLITDEDDGENSETESAAGVQTMTLSTPEENQNSGAGIVGEGRVENRSGAQQLLAPVRVPVLKSLQDSECESVTSDYSELGGPLRELEKDIEVVDREELRNYDCPLPDSLLHSTLTSDASFQRQAGESDEDYNRRVRKLNFLSLAQEFAELKRHNADACPIDFHLSQSGYARSTSTSSFDKRNSLSEVDQSLDGKTDSAMDQSDRGRTSRGAGPGPNAAVVMRDISARQSLRNRREGSMKRNSHHGTPTREARSSPGLDRPLSQPVEGDFEVFTMESSLPTMNWELLEQQLQLAAEEERNRLEARQTDREEIRRKLAMGTDEDYYGGERAFKKPSLSTRLQGGMNLQICFMNDAAVTADESEVSSSGTVTSSTLMTSSSMMTSSSTSQSHHNLCFAASTTMTAVSPSSLLPPSSSVSTSSASQMQGSLQSCKNRPKSDPGLLASQLSLPPSDESIAERQQRLQQEARMALAQASNMARMQLEVERKTKKKSPIADIVGVPELGDGRRMKISRKLLQEMNLAQLQVLVNDLHSQIESLNEELVHLLMERDDLHMEQDSMLVDIEDLTSFAQHMSETNNNKATQNNRNSSLLNKQLKRDH